MMECLSGPEASAWVKKLAASAYAARVPIAASVDVTRRCNLLCCHCYLGGNRGERADVAEMSTTEACTILDQLREAGTLFLLLTGGEPLTRPDFADIYCHAARCGFITSVFSNATLVNDAVVRLFQQYPPRAVDVTIYGASARTYERVTRVPGSFEQCIRGLKRLRAGGVRVTAKTMLLKDNQHECADIEALARQYGDKFRVDASIFPRLDGDRHPLACRLEPQVAADLDLSAPGRAAAWQGALERPDRNHAADDDLFHCGAGRSACHVDAQGNLMACMLSARCRYPLRQGSFADGWNGPIREYVTRKAPPESPCRVCPDWIWCGYCPEMQMLETGGNSAVPEWMCALGRCRREAVMARKRSGTALCET